MNRIVMTSFLLTTLVYFSSCQSGMKTTVKKDSMITPHQEDSLLTIATLSSSKPDKNQDTIEGHYISTALEDGADAPGCQITVDIVKRKAQYFYTLTSDTTYKGKLSISKNQESKETYVTFEGIEWAEYEGDISNDSEDERTQKPEMKLPIGIDGQLSGHEITIQNYGNAMNYYVKLAGCGDKFIRLVKQ